MKYCDLLIMEFKKNFKQILLNILILSSVFCIAVCMLLIATDVPKQIKSQINTNEYKNYRLSVKRVQPEHINELADFAEIDELKYSTTQDIIKQIHIENHSEISGDILYFNNLNSKRINIILGEIWSETDNNTQHIWISNELSNTLNKDINSSITLTAGNASFEYKVIGIFDKTNNIDYYLPLLPSRLIEELEIPEFFNGFIIIDIQDYLQIKKFLSDRYISTPTIGAVYDLLKSIQTITYLFWALTIIFVLSAIFILSSLMNMHIKTSKSYIGLLKALGASTNQIVCLFFMLMELILLISVTLGGIFTYFLSEYVNNLIDGLYGFSDFTFSPGIGIIILAFIISSLLLIPIVWRINHKVEKLQAIHILTNRN